MENSVEDIEFMELLSIIFDEPKTDKNFMISPSRFLNEMIVSTEERLEKLKKPFRKHKMAREAKTFYICPNIVIFQNYKLGDKYTATLSLINTLQASRRIKVMFNATPNFQISYPWETVCNRVPPGLQYMVNIHFCAHEFMDYIYSITFVTKEETFTIPIVAIGPRALIDFPDMIRLSDTPVKFPSKKEILLRNIGAVTAYFSVKINRPFYVNVSKITISPGEAISLIISCNPERVGIERSYMHVTFQGEYTLSISLECEAVTDNIILDNEEVLFNDTYISLTSREEFTIHNKGRYMCHYQWKVYEHRIADEKIIFKYKEAFEDLKEYEKLRYRKLEEFDLVDAEVQGAIYDRIYSDEIKEFNCQNQFLYHNKNFKIVPLEGYIVPNQSATFSVIFTPLNNNTFESYAYLDISGKEKRIPIKLKGTGLGPKILINVKSIDTKELCIITTHKYEIVAANKGHIEGTLTFPQQKLEFGGIITCQPNSVTIEPDNCQAMIMTFTSKVEGKFVEIIKFLIEESNEVLNVLFQGTIYCPILKLNIEEIDLKQVPFGFCYSKPVTLINDSQVPIQFSVQIFEVELIVFNVKKKNTSFPSNDIAFVPDSGIVPPFSKLHGRVDIRVKLVDYREFKIKIFMWDSISKFITLPISYTAFVPNLVAIPQEINIPFCFINYTYSRSFVIKNLSKFPGKVHWYYHDSPMDEKIIQYCINLTDFVIDGKEEINIGITIRTGKLGYHSTPIFFKVAGASPIELCRITCNGQGPVVSFDPPCLKFGEICLLRKTSKPITIISDSPIPANIYLNVNPKSVYKIDVQNINLGPQQSAKVNVSTFLVDPGQYKTTIDVKQDDNKSNQITVSGVGIGTSILVEPPIVPELNIKDHFTYQDCIIPIKFTNMGKRYHKILWTRNQNVKGMKDDNTEGKIQSVFSMDPCTFELDSLQSIIVMLKGSSSKPCRLVEDYYCFAIIEKSKREMIMSFNLLFRFINPIVEMSKTSMKFMLKVGPEETFQFLKDSIEIKNPCSIPLEINFHLNNSFFIVDGEEMKQTFFKTLESEEVCYLTINFSPPEHSKRSFHCTGQLFIDYLNHPKKDIVSLEGQVEYPTINLCPDILIFPCLPIGSFSNEIVILKNISNLPIAFNFTFLESTFSISEIEKIELEDMKCNEDLYTCKSKCGDINKGKFFPSISVEQRKNNYKLNEERSKEILCNKHNLKYEQNIMELKLQRFLFPIFESFDHSDADLAKSERLDCNSIDLKDVLSIEPSQGYLDAYECCIISIGANLPKNTKIAAEAECIVVGGEREILRVIVSCSNVAYRLSTYKADLGRKLFCEVLEVPITLSNISHATFDFYTYLDNCKTDMDDDSIEMGSLKTVPKYGLLRPDESVVIKVIFFPGKSGEFNEIFFLEMGYLEPVDVSLSGYAMYNQIYIELPRPDLNISDIDCYFALSMLSEKYLDKLFGLKCIDPVTVNPFFDDITVEERINLQKSKWYIVGYNDIYPTIMDIHLALERYLTFNENFPLVDHTFKKKTQHIPDLVVPPYLLDFGYVILDTSISQTISILNYGPEKTSIDSVRSKVNTYVAKGFQVTIKKSNINIGDSIPILVIFSPSSKCYPNVDVCVEDGFKITVAHGALIPITLKAVVTCPKISIDYTCIDFGTIKCGECLRKSIIIKNSGFVHSVWNAEIQYTTSSQKIPCPYYIESVSGSIAVEREFVLEIFFQPKKRGLHNANLIIHVDQNTEAVVTKLCGNAVISALAFSNRNNIFLPALPYSHNNNLFVSIQNVSSFPLEFYFIDYDKKYQEEKFLLNIYCCINNVWEVLVPNLLPGNSLPGEILRNYQKIVEDYTKSKIAEAFKAISLQSLSKANQGKSIDNIIVETETNEVVKDNSEILCVGKRENMEVNIPDPSFYEIAEYVDQTYGSLKSISNDSVLRNIKIIEPQELSKDIFAQKNGLILIFFGHPETDYLSAANEAAKTLHLPLYSIDKLIYEALVKNKLDSAIEINKVINFEFGEVASDTDLTNLPYDDEYDLILKRVKVLLMDKDKKSKNIDKSGTSTKDSRQTKNTSVDSKQSSKSGKQEKKKPSRNMNTLMQIPEDLFYDIFKNKLQEYPRGIIIESLESDFMKNTSIALNCILKSVGNISYIHFVILSYTYKDYLLIEDNKKIENDIKMANWKEERLAYLIQLDSDEYFNISQEDKEILREYFSRIKQEREELKRVRIQKKMEKQKSKLQIKVKETKKSAEKSKTNTQKETNQSKSPKSSNKSDTKEKDKKKLTPEEQQTKDLFDVFEQFIEELLHTLEYWDRRNAILIKPFVPSKKSAVKPSSKSVIDSKSSSKLQKTSSISLTENVDPNLEKEIGVPCWLINNACKSNLPKILSTFLSQTSLLRETQSVIEKSSKVHIQEKEDLFSVLCYTKSRKSELSDIFYLNDVQNTQGGSLLELNDDSKSISGRGHSSKTGRNSKSKRRSSKEKSSATSLEIGKEKNIFTTRRILLPGEVVDYKINLKPPKMGKYEYTFNIGIQGCSDITGFNCECISDIPRILMNPDEIYRKCVQNSHEISENLVYIKDENVFDFGTNFLCSPDNIIQTIFTYKNESESLCTIVFYLENNTIFGCMPDVLIVEPSNSSSISIISKLDKIGEFHSNLFVCITDNPKVEIVKLKNKITKFEFDINPKILNFDKVVIDFIEELILTLSNYSNMKVGWRFIEPEWALNIFKFSRKMGVVDKNSETKISVKYFPKEIEVIPKKALEVEVYDLCKYYDVPLYKTSLWISAESAELNVEYDSLIYLGENKGKQEYTYKIKMLNKGKINIRVIFELIDEKNLESKRIRHAFEMRPLNTILFPGKPFIGTLVFFPTIEMNLEEYSIYRCMLLDTMHSEQILELFDIKVTGSVFLSKYEMDSIKEINFGHLQTGTKKSYTLELKNVGKFDFDYTITTLTKLTASKKTDKVEKVSKESSRESPKSEKTSKDTKKSSMMDKKKKTKVTKLQMTGFVLASSTGNVDPNETYYIDIEALPFECKTYEETIVLLVNGGDKDDDRGRKIKLSAVGCEPLISFKDTCHVFREHYVVDQKDSFLPDNDGPYCVYIISEDILYFKLVPINTKKDATIYLRNFGYVIANITLQFTNNFGNVFTVEPENLDIGSYDEKAVTITFSPVSTDEYNTQLEIKYNNSKGNEFMKLSGEGCLGQIQMVEPIVDIKNQCSISFKPTLVGNTLTKNFSFKNVGKIPSKIIIEICFDTKDVFRVLTKRTTSKLMDFFDETENSEHVLFVNLQKNQLAEFYLQFTPKEEATHKVEVKIHNVNNPFEGISVLVEAVCYYHDIVFEGLDAMNINEETKNLSQFVAKKLPMGYEIDFGFTPLNKLQKKSFRIRNNSKIHTYKFKFYINETIKFSPAVGHLKPLYYKEVIVTFFTKTSLKFIKETLECYLAKISYINEDIELLSWDDRQKFVTWNPNNSVKTNDTDEIQNYYSHEIIESNLEETDVCKFKEINIRLEPEINIVTNSEQYLTLYLNVAADYATYSCNVKDIQLMDTYIMEKQTFNFQIENIGVVPLYINWMFCLDDILPQKPEINRNTSLDVQNISSSDITNLTLFSSLKETDTTGNTWSDQDELPFTISPSFVGIMPNEIQNFELQFTPIDTFEFLVHLKSNISNLSPFMTDVDIPIKAKGVLPLYYFELPPSKNFSFQQKTCVHFDLDNAKVIEFEAVGVNTNIIKKFNLVNTGIDLLTFNFQRVSTKEQFSFFKCLIQSASVCKGKKFEITFNFNPAEFGTFEEYFIFSILDHDVTIPFVLIGQAREPRVYLPISFLNMETIVVNSEISNTLLLKNDENIFINFNFRKESLVSNDMEEHLILIPKSGELGPKTNCEVCFKYIGKKIGIHYFYIECDVEKATRPVKINVKTNCVEILSFVSYINKNGSKIELVKNAVNTIDFGILNLNKTEKLTLNILNEGDLGFYYDWNLNSSEIEHMFNLTVDKDRGYLPKKTEDVANIFLTGFRKGKLENHQVKLKITLGPTYLIILKAFVQNLPYAFSFDKYDFGNCLIQERPTHYYSVSLNFTNLDNFPVLFENCFCNCQDLSIDFKSAKVDAKQNENVMIYFHPQLPVEYTFKITFTINSTPYNIHINGKGVNLELEISDKFVDFTSVKLKHIKRKIIKVINKSSTKINMVCDFWYKLVELKETECLSREMQIPEIFKTVKDKQEKEKPHKANSVKSDDKNVKILEEVKKKEENLKNKETSLEMTNKIISLSKTEEEKQKMQLYNSLQIYPKIFSLLPKQNIDVEIKYNPQERISDFREKIFYKVQDNIKPLCVVKGSTIAPDYCFDKDFLSFGCVIIGCSYPLNVLLKNNGDFRGNFKMTIGEGQHFVVSPISGKLYPKSDITVTIRFEPKEMFSILNTTLKCFISGVSNPLELLVSGSCVKLPNPIEILNFSCPVREKSAKTIILSNKTNATWKIKPILPSHNFIVANEIIVEKNTDEIVDIVYHPLEMTEKHTHNAPMFLPLPQGQGILYKLVGNAYAPLSLGKITREIFCKTNFTENLHIENWLNVAQYFTVTTELTSPLSVKTLYKIYGSKVIDLQPGCSKDYRWTVFVVNEQELEFKVVFTNEETKEYMFYEIYLTALSSGPLKVVNLKTCVREKVSYNLELENPVNVPVVYNLECDSNALSFEKSITIKPYTIANLILTYKPVKTEVTSTILTATCEELGSFLYEVSLTALPPLPEHLLKFNTTLGETCSYVITFTNNFDTPLELFSKFEHSMFFTDKMITLVNIGETVKLTVNFEPYEVGIFQSKLTLCSKTAGDFLYSLRGECELPKPKGPVLIKPGNFNTITFKNPFVKDVEFDYQLDNDIYYLKSKSELIKSRKSTKIFIYMQTTKHLLDTNLNPSIPIRGKLIISCVDSKEVKWVYYIQNEQ